MLKVYNSLTRRLEKFIPIMDNEVGLYTCGPTVYDYAHIGHARKYVGDDIIKRILLYLGYKVTHVMNITDVGHLVSDQDTGEDKLEKGARKHNKTVWEIADFFTKDFFKMTDGLLIKRPDVVCKATDHINEQIEQIKILERKGYTYSTKEAVYFNTDKFKNYSSIFGRQNLEEKKTGAREEVRVDDDKKNPSDFVLWFKCVGKFKDHVMRWESPWGSGFPGWHIECSAMSTKYLGDQFDIHTGGIDHIPVHHPNEIAQSEAASGKSPFVKYWFHHNFLLINGRKMSKSEGNYFTAQEIYKKGFLPIHLRYFFLTAQMTQPQNFTLEALTYTKQTVEKLLDLLTGFVALSENRGKFGVSDKHKKDFIKALEDNFNTPKALAVLWKTLKSDLSPKIKLETVLDFDKILGLGLENIIDNPVRKELPKEVQDILKEREKAREEKNWEKSDQLRILLLRKYNLKVKDTKSGQIV